MKTIFDELKQEVKNWWVSLILGILYVAVALGLMFFPFNGYAALSILFSISMLVSGLLEIAFAVSNRSGRSRALLPSSPLRTVHEGFPSYGSSFSKSLFICRDRLILLLVSIGFTG